MSAKSSEGGGAGGADCGSEIPGSARECHRVKLFMKNVFLSFFDTKRNNMLLGKDGCYKYYCIVFEGILVSFGLYFQEVHQHDNKNADFVPCLNAISAKLGTKLAFNGQAKEVG